ncbi:MAG: homocysteine S-methyltransferase family protein [Dehalococcoidia bacterium]|nr:homocysteine S-methyltransferase family protein [Dehalococcoidia bacterium]MCB9483310.1 homocysteine S-methyltransferase family protein [Dehalococcoidia bacterium]
MTSPTDRSARLEALQQALRERILVLDGSWGVLIQGRGLGEADFRGERFADWPKDLKGDAEALNLSQPDFVKGIHREYFAAGADIGGTNTFTATSISQAEFGLQDLAFDLNEAGARLAREAAAEFDADDGGTRWVAGAMGPTNKTLSISQDANDPGARAITFDEMRDAYKEAARGLIAGGADILLVETTFDTLNAKAAAFAIDEVFEEDDVRLPLWVSGTIVDLSGRTLTGQTVEAYWTSMKHARPFAIGFNCSLGSSQLRPYVAELARIADVPVSAYPNAGLPNEFGGYDETPEYMAEELSSWARDGLLNIVGTCCGSTPAHTKALADAVRGLKPRAVPEHRPLLTLSGLEALEVGA